MPEEDAMGEPRNDPAILRAAVALKDLRDAMTDVRQTVPTHMPGHGPTAAEAEVATLREALQDIGHELLRAEAHCPCGARRESPSTHPHVIDCPIGNAIARFESLATPTATAGALDSLIEHERWNSGRVDPTATAREGGLDDD